jgi:16S rRNA (guanine(966)-N(2))-methyltransferase RsmD
MRITGGVWRGRIIRAPRTGVRPTQDRVREALFSVLGERVPGARVLDLFAGSGAVGLEALSRGAASACWVESDRRVAALLRENVETLGAEAGNRILCADVVRALRTGSVGPAYDLVFADPPYDREGADGPSAWRVRLMDGLAAADTVRPAGWFVMEDADPGRKDTGQEPDLPAGWRLIKEKRYGKTRLVFMERVGEGSSTSASASTNEEGAI